MGIEWRDNGSSQDLFSNGKYRGLLSTHRPEYWWHNTPHESTAFNAETLEEAKQIALSIWAIQESVGVK